MKKLHLLIPILFFTANIFTQDPTVGLLYQDSKAADGYTLFSPNPSKKTFLIDNCGYIVNEWECESFPEIMSYLLEDGSLLRPSWGFIEKRNWDGDQTWRFELQQFGDNHHDIEPLPNGNVLVIITEYWDRDEAIAKGRRPDLIDSDFGVDAIYEIKPIGSNSGEVVWRWSFWDHLIQNVDSSKENFGNLSENPNRLNVNFNDLGDPEDWLHCNGIDYNAELDQIIISSRHTSEVYIIDHSTTTEEAQSNSGGQYGKGGDFLWRWGNIQVYEKGDFEDQKLYQQHNPSWIPSGYPDEGKISVFKNNADFDFEGEEEYSEIVVIDSKVTADGTYELEMDGSFGPQDFYWTWADEVLSENFWSEVESGVQPLANGNFLATLATGGKLVEVTRQGEVVWVYQNPVSFNTFSQFEQPFGFLDVFRAERYSPDFPAFMNRDLSPTTTVEDQNPLSENCSELSSVDNFVNDNLVITNNGDGIFEVISASDKITGIDIYSSVGELVFKTSANQVLDLNFLNAGIYVFLIKFAGNRVTNQKVFLD